MYQVRGAYWGLVVAQYWGIPLHTRGLLCISGVHCAGHFTSQCRQQTAYLRMKIHTNENTLIHQCNNPGGPGMTDGGATPPEESDDEKMMQKIEAEESVRKEIANLKSQYNRHEDHHKELGLVLESAYKRLSKLQSQLEDQRAKTNVRTSTWFRGDDNVQQIHLSPHDDQLPREGLDAHRQAGAESGMYNSFDALSAATFTSGTLPTMLLPGQQPDTTSDEPDTRGALPPRSSPLLRSSILDAPIAEEDEQGDHEQSLDLSLGDSSFSTRAEHSSYAIYSDEEEKLNESLQIAQADIERLERSLKKAEQLALKQKQEQASPSAQAIHSPEYEKRIAEARARRAAKDNIEVDSDSAVSGLLSPRDKALRTDLKRKEKKKEEAKKAKIKAEQRK